MKEYYQTENGKLYCCDNVEYLKTVETNSFDLTVTSPPYDNLRDYKGYSWDFEALARELFRTTKEGGVIVWVVGDATINGSETGSSFKQALYFMECGFNLHDTMIYQKDSISFPEINRYSQIFEYMFILSKGSPNTFNCIKDRKNLHANGSKHIKGNYRDTNGKARHNKENLLKKHGSRFNIWRISVGCNKSTKDKIAFEHPAIFPEKLAYDHIISWSNENDIVFDPFMGSGTTAKMCEISQRKWIGCEISKEYCEITKSRIETERTQLKMSFV